MSYRLMIGVCVLILGSANAAQAATIAGWHFNNLSTLTTPLAADVGVGSINMIPAAIEPLPSNSTIDRSEFFPGIDISNGNSVFVTGFDNVDVLFFQATIADHTDLSLHYDTRRSSTGATTMTWSYSTVGDFNWLPLATISVPANEPDMSWGKALVPGPANGTISGATEIWLKMSSTRPPNASGSLRIDNLVLAGTRVPPGGGGTPIPEPLTATAVGAIGCWLLKRRGGRGF